MLKKLHEFRNFKNLRNIEKMNDINKGDRNLYESIVSNEVLKALKDWIDYNNSNCVLIGGLALSYYVKPRSTMDVDVIFLSDEEIPTSVNKFKKTRAHAFQHNVTHVEIETISPQTINTPLELVEAVFKTANIVDGIKIASPAGIIALKLGRFKRQDQTDIENLIQYSLDVKQPIDLTPFNLSDELMARYNSIANDMPVK